jgi:uncharacterized protein
MSQYLSPGVYVEEVAPKSRSISGVGTSTAGFIGVVPDDVDMPVKPGLVNVTYPLAAVTTPKLMTSWDEFKNNFGDFQRHKDDGDGGGADASGWSADDQIAYQNLQLAVYGFFQNGGTRCWVMRVAVKTDLDTLDGKLEKFAPIDEIALVAVPGAVTSGQHTSILTHCFNLQDRFAILDGVQSPTTLTSSAIAPSGRSETGSYGAIYFPWIQVANPNKLFDPQADDKITIPPSGSLAGIYARVDSTRGVFKAPANEVVVGALDLDRLLSKSEQAGLNPEGINVIRSFNGAIKVWGARTRADETTSQFRYISTRRFFNFLRESIDNGSQFAVFEPNTPNLWQGITQTASGFLLNQWRDGALFGSNPEQAFFVKCDKDTNPKEVRELGQVVTEIGVAIVKPAEFVIFRIQQLSGG